MAVFSGNQILSHDFNSDFHARSPNIMELTVDRNNIPNKGGSQKIKSFHSGRDDGRTPTVFDGSNGSSLIYHSHNHATMDIALAIGICQSHEAYRRTPRGGNTLSLRYIDFTRLLMVLGAAIRFMD
jgi:hypothetical protein